MSIDHYILTKIHICICIFILVMFSTINSTACGTSSLMTYSINNLLQLSVKRLLQHVSTHQVSMVAMTTPYIAFKHEITYNHYISFAHAHNQKVTGLFNSSLFHLIILDFRYLCFPEDWIKQNISSRYLNY